MNSISMPFCAAIMFYKVNSTKVTVREYLFEGGILFKPIVWLIAVFTKTFRLRLPGSVDFPPVQRLSPFLVPWESIESDLLHSLASERAWLAEHQFTYCGDIYLNDVNSNTRYASCIYLSPNRKTIAWVRVRRWPQLPAKSKTTRVQFVSALDNGSVAITTSANRDLQEPPSWNMGFHTGLPVQELYRKHDEHCERVFGSYSQREFATPNDAIAFLDDLQSQFADYQASRGVFERRQIPMRTNATQATFSPTPTPTGLPASVENRASEPTFFNDIDKGSGNDNGNDIQTPAPMSGDDLVVAEVRKLETKQTQLLSKLLLLGVSVVAFLAVGGAMWDWSFVAMIIPILLIHELGHLIAMKIFGYKNVNMFFIPFFGAAVTGRHYNVAGWKKAIVSLAGPLPSIVLAIVIEIIGFVTTTEWLTKAALLMLIINLLNLLPFLPLDGGWVAHITLFSRSKYLDIGFRVFAILAMFLSTIFIGDKVLMYLGIAMLVGLPTIWKTLKVQEKLTNEPLPAPTNDLIPEAAIREISKACQLANLPGVNTAQLAATTIRVYEAINTRPTSWPATIGLWALHGGAIFVGFLGLFGYFAGSIFKRFSDIANTQYETISYELPKNDNDFRVGQGALPESAMLFWQLADEEQAKEVVESLKEDPQSSVARFGKTVLMSAVDVAPASVPRNDQEMFNEMTRLPSQEESSARNAPQLQRVRSRFAAVDARLFSASKDSLPHLKVTFSDQATFDRVLYEIDIMPNLDLEEQLLAAWTIGRKPTADHIRRRRLLHVIQERAEKLPWIVDTPEKSAMDQVDFSKMSKEQTEAFWQKMEKEFKERKAENAKLKKKWIDDGLARSSGETKKLIEAMLRFEADQQAARNANEKSFSSRDTSETSAQQPGGLIKFPKLEEYLADSAEALGYVTSSEPEYRYGVMATVYPESWNDEDDESMDVEKEATDSKQTTMIIALGQPQDSVATYSAIASWLYSQDAESVSINYERVVLSAEQLTTK